MNQQVGMCQLDVSSDEDDTFSNISHQWNGPDLLQLENLSFSQIVNQDLDEKQSDKPLMMCGNCGRSHSLH